MNDWARGDAPTDLGSVIGFLALLLGRGGDGGALTAGDLSALRRMDPRRPEPAFFKIEGAFLNSELSTGAEMSQERESRWAAVICGLAHLGTLHHPAARLGNVLADAGYSEGRFVRLIRADTERLVDELPSLARFLAAKGAEVDWTGAARLILSAGGPGEEETRRSIARDFYRSLARLEASSK